eukprot:TRINITY_DN28705_c1_g2_i2.p1 TRINITY_DN28705_c1_g2~~TRINITY_DN28705_c1_g2_i2.p1  ORF type:complete len:440 (+),score=47.41 TRINITY_DN28705_c1_g2_i2:52-1320(+)
MVKRCLLSSFDCEALSGSSLMLPPVARQVPALQFEAHREDDRKAVGPSSSREGPRSLWQGGSSLQRCRSEPPKPTPISFHWEGRGKVLLVNPSERKDAPYHNKESDYAVAPQSERRHFRQVTGTPSSNENAQHSERRHFHDSPAPGSNLSPRVAAAAVGLIDIDAPLGRKHFLNATEVIRLPWNQECWDDAVGASTAARRRQFFDQTYLADRYAELLGRPGKNSSQKSPSPRQHQRAKRNVNRDVARDLDLEDVAYRLSVAGSISSDGIGVHNIESSHHCFCKGRMGSKRNYDSAVASTAASASGSAAASAAPSVANSGVATPDDSDIEECLPNIKEEETPRPTSEHAEFYVATSEPVQRATEPESIASSLELPHKLPLGMRRVLHAVLSKEDSRRVLLKNMGTDAKRVHRAVRELPKQTRL